MNIKLIACVVLALICAGASAGQMQQRSAEGYIEKLFESRVGELPRMGWFAPAQGFAARTEAQDVFIFAPLGLPSTGRRKSVIASDDIKQLRDVWGEACELDATDQLTVFDSDREVGPARALYTTKRYPGEVRAGLITIPLSAHDIASVNGLLKWPSSGALRRDEAIGVRPGSDFYSFHRLYKAATGALMEEAVILHRKDGGILAHLLEKDQDSGPACDGCGIPNYIYAASGVYRALNMFEFPGFAYPVLLLDTSTVEGQALSLMTFTPNGRATQFRVYEYVINCR